MDPGRKTLFFLPRRGLLWEGGARDSLDSGQASCFWVGRRKTDMAFVSTPSLFSLVSMLAEEWLGHTGVCLTF